MRTTRATYAAVVGVALLGCGQAGESAESDAAALGWCANDSHCDDLNECTSDLCVDGTCESYAWYSPTPCLGGIGSCAYGSCVIGGGLECVQRGDCPPPASGCVDPACSDGFCLYYARQDGSYCDEGGTVSVCIQGQCAVCQADKDCGDGNACSTDLCVNGQCNYGVAANGTACEAGDHCVAGECCHGCGLNGAECVSDCPSGMICNQYKVCAP